MTKRTISTTILATLLLVSAVSTPAVADTGDQETGVLESVSETAESGLETVAALADGAAGAAKGYAARAAAYDPFGESASWSATESAASIEAEVDANGTVYARWLSTRLEATESRNVLAVTVKNHTAAETVYLTSAVRNGSFHDLSATRSTSRTVDRECTLSGAAARNAPDELATFRESYAVPNESLSSGYLGRFGAQYGGKVSCSFIKP
ncbi:hypothetical protein [Halosimplex pelagicum]|uniref:Uncharacterized protein n=1 Tax=Halosimplex pelagicum TaxID=869886 RepID=A0A7D5PCQ6_9EURY|nr:hypothetical protein [Halosimplex pelagicum]QLH83402.1 hypothetical protein HZS54_17965 [Halosimplex pelagicum]